jgi:hypothetical protein
MSMSLLGCGYRGGLSIAQYGHELRLTFWYKRNMRRRELKMHKIYE